MRSFKVVALPEVIVGNFTYADVAELTCRGCEERDPLDRSSFVVCATPRVGEAFACPFCEHESQIPKRSRWQA